MRFSPSAEAFVEGAGDKAIYLRSWTWSRQRSQAVKDDAAGAPADSPNARSTFAILGGLHQSFDTALLQKDSASKIWLSSPIRSAIVAKVSSILHGASRADATRLFLLLAEQYLVREFGHADHGHPASDQFLSANGLPPIRRRRARVLI